MVTLKDIAQETGFSFKTVSRVINGESGVAIKTADKINEAIDRLGYVANPMASSLKSGKTGLIGILTGQLGMGIKTAKLYAIQRELEKSGKKSLLSCIDLDDRDLKKHLLPFFKLVDGIIVLNPPDNDNLINMLIDINKPVLLVDGYSPHLPSLTIDRERGVLEAFSLLRSQYDNFIYFNGMVSDKTDGRYKGFLKSTENLEENKSAQIIALTDTHFENGYQGGLTLIENLNSEKRTLVLCTNDQMAFGLMKALYEHNISVPHSVGVLGFDGDNYGPFGYKSLATIKQPVEELGIMTVEILENIMRGTTKRVNYSIQTRYISGDSN